MDIVLEITDTFIGDYLWSYFLPARPAPQDYADAVYANSSAKTFSAWTYEPSTHLFSLEPSQYAYMSSFLRDDPLRQFTSLYFITWYVLALLCLLNGGISPMSCDDTNNATGGLASFFTSSSPLSLTSSFSTSAP